MLVVEALGEFKGFGPTNKIEPGSDLIVLTGRNGVGKTRYLEAIVGAPNKVSVDGVVQSSASVRMLSALQLCPEFNSGQDHIYNKDVQTAQRDYLISCRKIINVMNESEVGGRVPFPMHGLDGIINYSQSVQDIEMAAKVLNKSIDDLRDEELLRFYRPAVHDVLGRRSLADVCNSYIKARHDNRYNQWRHEDLGEDVEYFDGEGFLEHYGPKPWEVMQEILHDIFDGKFRLEFPDEASHSYSYEARVYEVNGDRLLQLKELSSGERTLFWLALTLFN
ncbi:ATP-binding protein [Pseudomonas chlororaphis]|uniref:ATP-binding protein n=1 Tax=Pseudomonas chlororaphis TaxID=587753 RepID=UPI001472DD46|nr:ATP-binding protein [Pseudomonas chlororaphis]NNB41714.1 ATP-binding protein [Pseudomonas chlororaphis]